MPYKVRTNVANVQLPNGKTYPLSNTVVVLTDAQYTELSNTAFSSGVLTDQGVVQYGTDQVFTQGATTAAPAAVTSVQEATANATDLATAQTLVNSLKIKYNAAQVDIVALRATVAALQTNLSGTGKALAP